MMKLERAGMTLVEVVAAISLTGTLLAVTIVAGARHLRQLTLADRKQQAVKLLDRGLVRWSQSGFRHVDLAGAMSSVGCPLMGNGEVGGGSGFVGAAEAERRGRSGDRAVVRHSGRFRSAERLLGASGLGTRERLRLSVMFLTVEGKAQEVAWVEVVLGADGAAGGRR
ncbi:MAG: hypothetical protein ACF788_04245 [Novipirellula sp. JB048]